jgi:ankyrin repeat protein
MLPLHTACSYRASPAVVQAILAAYPEAAAFRDDRGGATPLHTACEHGCSVETLRVLLQHSEHGITALSLRDKTYRRKPLQMLNGRKNMHEEQRNLQTLRQARTRQRAIRQTQGQENGQLQRRNDRDELVRLDEVVNGLKQTEFWQKASILMVVEHQQQPLQPDQEIGDGSMILHAAIAIEDCPASLREYAVLLYEDLLLVPADQETGRLPLHLAAATLRFGRRSNEMSALILDLVVASPAASTIRDRSGRLPLTIALQEIRRQNSSDHRVIGHHAQREWWSVVSDGLQALIEANPLALLEQQEEEDVGVLSNSKRHPYVLSRLSPNSVFELIRAHPSMVLPLEEGADETIYSRR